MNIGGHKTHPAADAFPLMDQQAMAALVDDVVRNGQLKPITRVWVDTGNGNKTQEPLVLDGRNRLRACLQLKKKPVFEDYEGDDPVGYVISLNLARRHLSESQRALVAAKLATLAVGTNQHESGKEGASNEAPSQSAAAERLNVSRSSVQRAKKVLEHGAPELVKAVESGDLDVGFASQLVGKPREEQRELVARVKAEKKRTGKSPNARQVLRAVSRESAAAVIEQEPSPLPSGPFRVITADPPWAYDTRNDDGTRRGTTSYPTMSVQEIAALPVRERAHDDCILWLWITNAHLIEGAHVPILEAWGFTGKTILTWVKDRPGLGNYLRGITEHVIVATRGKPTLQLIHQTTVLYGQRREHSRKPVGFYELVEKLCPGSKLELFAREPRPGWQTWGAESEKFAEHEAPQSKAKRK